MSTDTPLWETPGPGQAWPAAYDRILLNEVDSTMAEAGRRAKTLSGPTWIMAQRQTAARGRRGRPWQHPDGNFAASLLMRPGPDPAQAALRSFVAANALRLTLAMCVDPARLSLKWPNDVLLDGGKVAGILLESWGGAGAVEWLSIGIGVNLAAAPPADQVEEGAVPPVSVLGQGGTPFSPQDMLFWLAAHFADQEALFTQTGFDPVRREWLNNAAHLGKPIRARTAQTETAGTFVDVDKAGQLVLETPKGRMAIPAADVFF